MKLLQLVVLSLLCSCASGPPAEFVDIAFVPSIETDHYRHWDFDLEACRDLHDERIDDAFVRDTLLATIQVELAKLGYERRVGGPLDFTVHYELWLAGPGDLVGIDERVRGRIYVRDQRTARLVWRGERKAPVGNEAFDEERVRVGIQRFVQELLEHTRKLKGLRNTG